MKRLREILEYKSFYPRAKGEQKFMDQHTVKVNADPAGNGDEVFKGTKVKVYDRAKNRRGANADPAKETSE